MRITTFILIISMYYVLIFVLWGVTTVRKIIKEARDQGVAAQVRAVKNPVDDINLDIVVISIIYIICYVVGFDRIY